MHFWSCRYWLSLVRVVLATLPRQLSCSHFVSGNIEAEAGHWSLGDEQGLMWRSLTIFKNFLVTASGLHDPRRFKSPPAVCPCCCKVNGNGKCTELCPGLYNDAAEGNGFIKAKLADQPREHITGCTSPLCRLLKYLFANMWHSAFLLHFKFSSS